MNKKDLIDAISKSTGLSKTSSAKALNATLEGITKGLEKDGKVVLRGFGTFSVSRRVISKDPNYLIVEIIKGKIRKQSRWEILPDGIVFKLPPREKTKGSAYGVSKSRAKKGTKPIKKESQMLGPHKIIE